MTQEVYTHSKALKVEILGKINKIEIEERTCQVIEVITGLQEEIKVDKKIEAITDDHLLRDEMTTKLVKEISRDKLP